MAVAAVVAAGDGETESEEVGREEVLLEPALAALGTVDKVEQNVEGEWALRNC